MDYLFEVSCLASILVYFLFSFTVSRSHRQKARQWHQSISQLLSTSNLLADGACHYFTRFHVENVPIYASFQLSPTHDLFYWIYCFLFTSRSKTILSVQLELPMFPSTVFAIVPKGHVAHYKKERFDIRTFTRIGNIQGLDANLSVLLEQNAVSSVLVTEKSRELISLLSPYWESLFISDQPSKEPESSSSSSTTPVRLILQCRCPDSPSELDSFYRLFHVFAFQLIQNALAWHPTADQIEKFQQQRNALSDAMKKESLAEKRQRMQDEKVAKQRAQEQALLNLSPEEQRRQEAALQKKEKKKKTRFIRI